jgi:hypothetical protein
MTQRILITVLTSAYLLTFPSTTRAQLSEHNAVMTIGAGTVLGTAVGLITGFVLAEAVDSSGTNAIDDWSYVEWPYVTGTYLGFLTGVVIAATHPLVSYNADAGESSTKIVGLSAITGGTAAGLLAIATAIVAPDVSFEDGFRAYAISTVLGTAGGIVVGLHHVSNRPSPSMALLDVRSGDGTTVGIPVPTFQRYLNGGVAMKLPLFRASW